MKNLFLKTALFACAALFFSCEEDDKKDDSKKDDTKAVACSELSFEKTLIDNNTTDKGVKYLFKASDIIPFKTETVVYGWFIDGKLVTEGTFEDPKQSFEYTFNSNGTFEVCAGIETPDCKKLVKFCKEIEVSNIKTDVVSTDPVKCDKVNFSTSAEATTTSEGINYTFTATDIIIGKDESPVVYAWKINDDLKVEGTFDDTKKVFTYKFTENGTYSVCVSIETPDCRDAIEKCIDIFVNNIPKKK